MTTQQAKDKFTLAYIVMTASSIRAQKKRNMANNMKPGKSLKSKLTYLNKRFLLLQEAERIETRGRQVFNSVADYKGKFVNYRDVTNDGDSIYEIFTTAGRDAESLRKAELMA